MPTPEPAAAAALEQSVAHIREMLGSVPEFKILQDQVEFTITPEGLRVELIDASESSFFNSGSADLRPETERMLGIIARELGTLPNTVIVEGHTDGQQYAGIDTTPGIGACP